MTTQLPERLRDLADEAPGPLSPDGLWHTGRRRHRRRMVSAVAVVGVAVALTAGAGYGSWHSRRPDPAAPPATPTGPMAVPQRFFRPSPWLSGTSAPGRLVAVLGATRDRFPWGQDKNAFVGVTAGSQTYRFLDLPGQSPDVKDVALSPDGRHLAYWLNGWPTSAATIGDRSTVGVANLDLTTGEVQRRRIPTEHGLVPGLLTWTSDDNLAVAAGQYTSAQVNSFSSHTDIYFIMWRAVAVEGTGPPALTPGKPSPGLMTTIPNADVGPTRVISTQGFGGMASATLLRVWNADQTSEQSIRLSHPLQSVAYDAGAGRIVGTRGNPDKSGSTSGRLLVGNVVESHGLAAGGHVELTAVPGGRRYLSVLSWADRRHVVAEQLTSTGERYWVVDLRTGARAPLTTTGYQATGSSWYAVLGLAGDALRHPTSTEAIAPPQPWNPRWLAGSVVCALLAVALALVAWRRHVRG